MFSQEGAGRLSTVTTDYNTERVHDMVLLDRWLTIDEVAYHLQIMKNYVIISFMFYWNKGCIFIVDNHWLSYVFPYSSHILRCLLLNAACFGCVGLTYFGIVTGLAPNTVYRVTVRAKNIRAPSFDEKASQQMERFSCHIDFRTLPKGEAAIISCYIFVLVGLLLQKQSHVGRVFYTASK
jgi:hypothetical protein